MSINLVYTKSGLVSLLTISQLQLFSIFSNGSFERSFISRSNRVSFL